MAKSKRMWKGIPRVVISTSGKEGERWLTKAARGDALWMRARFATQYGN